MSSEKPVEETGNDNEDVKWPLDFYMPRFPRTADGSVARWWSHTFYRGPDGKKIQVKTPEIPSSANACHVLISHYFLIGVIQQR